MNNNYSEIIRPKRSLFDLNIKEVWSYRDLLMMFVRRDFVAGYKQTILGPLWFFIQPIFTTIMFTFVFGNIANISTDGQPKILFYLSGLTIWNYFAECFTKTSNIFIANSAIFGKVYFPRLISPLAIVVSGLMRFGVQMLLFISILIYFNISGAESVKPNTAILLFPFLVFLMAGFALGFGMIVSSMTTKYRDLSMLIGFGISLFMYATPIIYPVNAIPEKYKTIVLANPIAPVVETFRYAFLGSGELNWLSLGYSSIWVVFLLSLGVIVFNRVQQTFMDTV
jgi:lipopolysaccharide transport system permease protein